MKSWIFIAVATLMATLTIRLGNAATEAEIISRSMLTLLEPTIAELSKSSRNAVWQTKTILDKISNIVVGDEPMSVDFRRFADVCNRNGRVGSVDRSPSRNSFSAASRNGRETADGFEESRAPQRPNANNVFPLYNGGGGCPARQLSRNNSASRKDRGANSASAASTSRPSDNFSRRGNPAQMNSQRSFDRSTSNSRQQPALGRGGSANQSIKILDAKKTRSINPNSLQEGIQYQLRLDKTRVAYFGRRKSVIYAMISKDVGNGADMIEKRKPVKQINDVKQFLLSIE